MLQKPVFDPDKSYEDNLKEGPFGAFADGKAYPFNGEPKFDFLGMKLNSPIGIPAGPLLNGKFVKAALDKGFDAPMHKTVRTRAYPSHPWPNVLAVAVDGDLTLDKAAKPLVAGHDYKEPLSITNSFGNPSQNPDIWQKDIAECAAYARKGQIVAASVEGTRWEGYGEREYLDDWAAGAGLLKEAGAHAVEANLSCPNEGTASLVCFDAEKSRSIAEAVKNKIGDHPLLLKTAYFSNEDELEKFVKAVGSIADGISAINTISAEVVDAEGRQALPGEKRKRSGICGHSIKWAGLEMTRRLKNLREKLNLKFAIVASGGVMTPEDYKEYREAGADLVMSATGAMWNPLLAIEIKERLNGV